MLALNASIEAARAGDAGQGFAVVAQEIQVLAANTTNATDNVNRILNELEQETEKARNSADRLTKANKENDALVQKSYESFESITGDINKFAGNIKLQAGKMTDIRNNTVELTKIIENFSAFTEELTASAEGSQAVTNDTIAGIQQTNAVLKEIMAQVEALNEKAQ